MDYRELKVEVAEARDLADHGNTVEALEVLENVFNKVHWWLRNLGADPQLQKIMDAARKLSGQIRGQMTEAVLKGPQMGAWWGKKKEDESYEAHQKQEYAAYQRRMLDLIERNFETGLKYVQQGNRSGFFRQLGKLEGIVMVLHYENSDRDLIIQANEHIDNLVAAAGPELTE